MSTKTSIKRIALVAVSALALGLFSTAPSNAAYSGSSLIASVESVPYAGETSGTVASFTFNATSLVADATTVTVTLTNKPSGSTLSNADIALSDAAADAETAFAANVMTITAGDVSPEAAVNVSLGGASLIAGSYTLTFTPAPTAVGATVQTITLNVTARPSDSPRLTSINAVKANRHNGTNVATGLIKDQVTVAAGAVVGAGGAGTIRLRADLISFPTGGYVNTFASIPLAQTAALGNFKSLPDMTATANSNLVTLTTGANPFDACDPAVAADKAATYTTGTNNISAAAGCDAVTARAGSTALALNATGLGFYSFTPAVAGTYVLRVWQDADNDGTVNVNEVRTDVTITITAYPAASAQYSTAYINALNPGTGTGIAYAKASTCTAFTTAAYAAQQGNFVCDETVVAPKGSLTAAVEVARIYWELKDADDDVLDGRSTFDKVNASISGPGTLAIGVNGALVAAPVGRNVVATPVSLPTTANGHEGYVSIFNDGNAGEATITLTIGSLTWKKTVKFYGAVTKVAATQGLKVLKKDVAGTYGCLPAGAWPANSPAECPGADVATTVAVSLTATDAAGIGVPYVTYLADTSDATKLPGIATTAVAGDYAVDYAGISWFEVAAIGGNNPSGSSATLTYKTNVGTALAPVYVSGSALSFAFGGALASATAALNADATNMGAANTFTLTGKDSAGNAPYDQDLESYLKSDYAIQLALGQNTTTLSNALSAMIGGVSSFDFYNPIVLGTYKISGWADGFLGDVPISVTLTTTSTTTTPSDAVDAANDAVEAANAATDAANAAAEAADAATAAAQDAQAAVADLAAQVATLIGSIKNQLTRLANLIVKIQKKVRA